MHKVDKMLLTWIFVTCVSGVTYIYGEEFCNGETFKPTCGLGEVVMIDNARYGRMHMGRCVSTNLGKLNYEHYILFLHSKSYIWMVTASYKCIDCTERT